MNNIFRFQNLWNFAFGFIFSEIHQKWGIYQEDLCSYDFIYKYYKCLICLEPLQQIRVIKHQSPDDAWDAHPCRSEFIVVTIEIIVVTIITKY